MRQSNIKKQDIKRLPLWGTPNHAYQSRYMHAVLAGKQGDQYFLPEKCDIPC
jgi:hypothetical protein